MSQPTSSTWLFSRTIDIALLFIPVWLTWLFSFWLPTDLYAVELPLWGWVLIVLLLDVSHVWSTIFRTYFDKQERQAHRRALIWSPIIALVVLLGIAYFGSLVFWRCMAYFALFHFVKQQYGFMMIYVHKHAVRIPKHIGDKFILYFSVLYPVAFWHLSDNRTFNWFFENDFLNLSIWLPKEVMTLVWPVAHGIYCFVLLAWVAQEVMLYIKNNYVFPMGKVLWLLTSAGTWFLGIVYFNSDIVFSVTNVVAHCVPYLVLVFFYVEKKRVLQSASKVWKWRTSFINISAMLVAVLLFALLEEYFWDGLINRDKQVVFEFLFVYPFSALESDWAFSVAVALLSLPQVTHYVLDGVIWKGGLANPFLKPVLFDGLP